MAPKLQLVLVSCSTSLEQDFDLTKRNQILGRRRSWHISVSTSPRISTVQLADHIGRMPPHPSGMTPPSPCSQSDVSS
jgi:hypothetical protein